MCLVDCVCVCWGGGVYYFSGLPAFMSTLLEKLTAHIKRECSICHDLSESCGAGELCKDPLDIIYPFQVNLEDRDQ